MEQLQRDFELGEGSGGSGSASKAAGCPGPLSSAADHDGVTMRKPDASVAARKASLPAGSRDDAAVQLVCLALVLAPFLLAARIANLWGGRRPFPPCSSLPPWVGRCFYPPPPPPSPTS